MSTELRRRVRRRQTPVVAFAGAMLLVALGACTETRTAAADCEDVGALRCPDEEVSVELSDPDGGFEAVTQSPAATSDVRDPLPPAPDPSRPAVVLDITVPSPNVPNPFVLPVDDRYLLFATETRDEVYWKMNVPVSASHDLEHWTWVHDALPQVGAWAVPEATWAPDVARIGDGWVLYYTARVADSEPPMQCIGAAVAADPAGPYAPEPEPIVCQRERNGSIDPRHFVDADGTTWLHWKSDDNADVGGSSTSSIYSAPLTDDGLGFSAEPEVILDVSQEWEGRIVEAPDMVAGPDGTRWLFYSGNWFNQSAYAIGVARCDTPAGPCTKPFDGPWLATNAQGEGPGEAALFEGHDGVLRIVYAPVGQDYEDVDSIRPVALGVVAFDAAGPYLADPALAFDRT